jgi:hypothetical protein
MKLDDLPINNNLRRSALLHHHNKTGFRGVYLDRKANKWRAEVYPSKGPKRASKRFATKREAARAYDILALELYGKDAALNFPLNGELKSIFGGLCTHGDTDIYISPKGEKRCRRCNADAARRYKKRVRLEAR